MWSVIVSAALAAPCTLAGSVSGPSGLLAGAEVVLARAMALPSRGEGAGEGVELPGWPTARVVTDVSGGFRFPELDPGRWHVSVVQAGLAPGTVPPIGCVPGGAPTVEITLVSGEVQIRGRLTDSVGRSIGGSAVISRVGEPLEGPAYLSVDRGGQFEVVLPRGFVYRVVGVADGYQATHEMLFLDRDRVDEGMDVRLELSKAATLSGRVERAGGSPLSGARLQFGPAGFVSELPASHATQRASYSDASGRFTIDLPHGISYGLGATHPDGWVGCVDRQMSLTPGEHRKGITLHVLQGRSLRGRVVGPDKRAVANVEVWWRADGCDLVGTAWTDTSGQFSFDSIPSEDIEVWVPGGSPSVRVASHTIDVTVTMPR